MKYLSDNEIKSMADDWFGWLRDFTRTTRNKAAVFGGIPEDPRCADLSSRQFRMWEKDARTRLGKVLATKILDLSQK